MDYEVFEAEEGAWLAEAIDHGSEGEMYWAMFYGLEAERRARQYAEWMNAQLHASDHVINAS